MPPADDRVATYRTTEGDSIAAVDLTRSKDVFVGVNAYVYAEPKKS